MVAKKPPDPGSEPESEGESIDHIVRGVACPHCGGHKLLRVWSRRRGGLTLRLRECSDCGTRVRTSEKIVN